MGLIELFLIAVGLSMDAFAVSVCKGLAMPKCTFKKAAIVGLWFGGFQALMPAIGYILGAQFQEAIASIDHWIAFVLLALIGGNMIHEALDNDEEEADASLLMAKHFSPPLIWLYEIFMLRFSDNTFILTILLFSLLFHIIFSKKPLPDFHLRKGLTNSFIQITQDVLQK